MPYLSDDELDDKLNSWWPGHAVESVLVEFTLNGDDELSVDDLLLTDSAGLTYSPLKLTPPMLQWLERKLNDADKHDWQRWHEQQRQCDDSEAEAHGY